MTLPYQAAEKGLAGETACPTTAGNLVTHRGGQAVSPAFRESRSLFPQLAMRFAAMAGLFG